MADIVRSRAVLDALEQGGTLARAPAGPLELRLRAVIAEADSMDWRAELLTGLGDRAIPHCRTTASGGPWTTPS
ncbi:hypothetical protein AB0L59_36360 [Streptomyces sp. NPDC052109]|uniref:hypothetical protein n=1 Tax=Streptomyces sp. NPDC052109 TaxID=3155527 RepID=UPI003420739C